MKFKAELEIIGVNPFVFVPEKILNEIFIQAGTSRGFIPIAGKVNGDEYIQTLVKYAGNWRLYINTAMLKNSPKRIGESIDVEVEYDPIDRTIKPHPEFIRHLNSNKPAKAKFDSLPPSRQKEIVRYISSLKTKESVERNCKRAIEFLLGKGKFVGREKP